MSHNKIIFIIFVVSLFSAFENLRATACVCGIASALHIIQLYTGAAPDTFNL